MSNKHDTDTFEATSRHQYVTRTAKIRNVDGIIHARIVLSDAKLLLEDAQENIHAIAAASLGHRCPVLADIRNVSSANREARVHASSDQAQAAVSALGLLVASKLSQLIANFFLGFVATSFPMRVFADEEKAMTWLREFL